MIMKQNGIKNKLLKHKLSLNNAPTKSEQALITLKSKDNLCILSILEDIAVLLISEFHKKEDRGTVNNLNNILKNIRCIKFNDQNILDPLKFLERQRGNKQ